MCVASARGRTCWRPKAEHHGITVTSAPLASKVSTMDDDTRWISLHCRANHLRLTNDGASWHASAGHDLGHDLAAAEWLRSYFELTHEIPHDSLNLFAESAFGSGTITSRGYPPWQWSYVHGKRLQPETSAATTLYDSRSARSLCLTLAGLLARVRILSDRVVLRLSHNRPYDPPRNAAASASLFGSAAWAGMLQANIIAHLAKTADPYREMYKVCERLNRVGHGLRLWDEDGSTLQHWLSSRVVISYVGPDYEALEAGSLPELRERDEQDEREPDAIEFLEGPTVTVEYCNRS